MFGCLRILGPGSNCYDAVAELLGNEIVHETLVIPHQAGKLRALLYAQGGVVAESLSENGEQRLEIRMPRADLERILGGVKLTIKQLLSSS